jgi:hypothetical protein
MKTIKQLTLLFIISCIYSSCSKDCEKLKVTKYLYQEDKDLIPYKGNEVLTFLHVNTGDTITFIGESNWKTYYNTTYSGIDCSVEEKWEGRGIAFVDHLTNKIIYINNRKTQNWTTLEIDFENNYFLIGLVSLGGNYEYDSLLIQNKIYYNISKFSNENLSPTPTDYYAYFNKSNGLIKLELENGDIWELINK